MSTLQKLKDSYVNTFVALESFDERCTWLSDTIHELYNAQKILVIFHSERKSRYTIRNTKGFKKSAIVQFNFFRQTYITFSPDGHAADSLSSKISLDDWPWFQNSLNNKLKESGLQWIVPLWSGYECLGAVIFSSNAGKATRKTQAFVNALPDIANLLEIAFLKALVKREAWEKQVLLDLGRTIGHVSESKEILNHILEAIIDVIDCDAAGIFLLHLPDKSLEQTAARGFSKDLQDNVLLKAGKGIVGWAIANNKEIIVPDVRKDKRYVMARKGTRSEVVVPINYGNSVMGAFVLESDKVHNFRYHDVELLRAFAAQTSIVIENSKLLYQALDAKQLYKELEIAKNIQKALLPNKMPKLKGYDFAAMNNTSQEIGGDLYDFMKISENKIGVAIGDVSGKGVPGALLMAALNSTFRGFIQQANSSRKIVRLLNNELYELTEPSKYATFFYGVINAKSGVFCSTNAGHNPPLLVRNNGDWQALKIGGPLLGVIPDFNYQSEDNVMKEGDILFFYTDGVSETFNPYNEEFGIERIVSCLQKWIKCSASNIIRNLKKEIQEFSNKDQQDDDITMIVIKKSNRASKK